MINSNINTVYGVGMGVTFHAVFSDKETAEKWMNENVKPQQISTDAWDDFKPIYQYPYILEHKPGTIVESEIHPGYGYLKLQNGKDEYDITIFDYVSLEDIKMGNPALVR